VRGKCSRYGRHAQAEIEPTAEPHVDRTEQSLALTPGVVKEDGDDYRGGYERGLLAGQISGEKTGGKQGGSEGCRPASRDSATWDRTLGTFDRIELSVEEIIEHDAARVEAGRREQEPGQGPWRCESGYGVPRQDIGERRRDVGGADEFEIGTKGRHWTETRTRQDRSFVVL
jgi:hypothetical protein